MGCAKAFRQYHLVAQIPRVAVILVDVVGGLVRAHPLQRRAPPRADRGHRGAPRASTEDDDVRFALRWCHGDQTRCAAAAWDAIWLLPTRGPGSEPAESELP